MKKITLDKQNEKILKPLKKSSLANLVGGAVAPTKGDTYVYTSDGKGGWHHDKGK